MVQFNQRPTIFPSSFRAGSSSATKAAIKFRTFNVLLLSTAFFFLIVISMLGYKNTIISDTSIRNINQGVIGTTQAKWKLWHEMLPSEQKSELERVSKRAKPYGKILGNEMDTSKFHNTCPNSGEKPILLGEGGEHMVSVYF